tara:strand:- start:3386 stop:4060 length:675 start_codon:yes stop_codon:yes gene_type:complete
MQTAARKLKASLLVLGMIGATFDATASAEQLDAAQMPKSLAQYTEATGHDLYHRGLYPEAIEVWRRAFEENGDAGAVYVLGTVYLDGLVTETDYSKAIALLKKSALRGEVRAQFELGTLYDDGIGVARNAEVAVFWYTLASTQNDSGAEFNLATHYWDGDGVEADKSLAYAYYHLAVAHSIPEKLLLAVEQFADTLTEDQRATGERRAGKILETRSRSATMSVR